MKVLLIYVHIELKNSEKTQTNSWQHSQNRCLIVSSNNKDVCWEKLSALLSTPVADPEFPGSALTYYLVKFLPRAA